MRSGYRQTEVGLIPREWELKPLGSVLLKGRLGGNYANQLEATEFPLMKMGNVARGYIDTTKVEYIAKGAVPDPQHRLREGDVLFNTRNTVDFVGKVAIWRNELPVAYYNSNLMRLELDPRYVCSNAYANAALNSAASITVLRGLATGTTSVAAIYTRDLLGMPFITPPLHEQRAIAEALSDVDALLGELDRLIAKKRDLKQAAMQQLLTGQTRLPGFGPTVRFRRHAYGSVPADWDVKPFRLVSTMSGRIGWQGLKQDEFTQDPDDPFLITGMNFKDGKIRWEEVYHIPERRYFEAPPIQLRTNDILMTKDGTIGKLLFVDSIPHPGRASLNSHLLVFRPINRQYESKYLFYQLNSPTFAQHIELHKSGSTFYGLTQDATGKYPVILPTVPEQTAIAEVLSDMDAELAALEQRRDKTRALKQGMMQELLSGRTRLV